MKLKKTAALILLFFVLVSPQNVHARRLIDDIPIYNDGNYDQRPSYQLPSYQLPSVPKYTPAPTEIRVSQSFITLQVDDVTDLYVQVLPFTADQQFAYSSTSTCVSIMQGAGSLMIIGESEGSSTIIVTTDDGSQSAFCHVTVTKKEKAPSPSPSPQMPSVPNDVVKVYDKEGLEGGAFFPTASTGYKLDKDELWKRGMNDKISSIYVPVGWRLTLCRDDNFNGSNNVFEARWDPVIKSRLEGDINNEASSAIFEKIADDPRLPVVYQDSGFRGNSQTLNVGSYRANQLSFGNDQISSIKIPPSYQVTLYEHDNFQGRSVTYTWQQANVADFNDKCSSIRISSMGIYFG